MPLFPFMPWTSRAVTPQTKVSDSKAKPIMMTETCRLSRGEESTGMTWPICGSIWLMWETRRKNPDIISPKGSAMRKRL